jgi:hypothetical protein
MKLQRRNILKSLSPRNKSIGKTKKLEDEQQAKAPINPDIFIKVSKAMSSSKKIKKQAHRQ